MRTQSVNYRAVSASTTPHRTQSHQQSRGRDNSSSYQGNLNNVARKDHEQTDLARPQSSNRTSSLEKHNVPSSSTRAEPVQSSNRGHSKFGPHSRYAETTPTKSASDATGRVPPGSSGSARRRTTIGTSSGQWALGKTIGAGSMGKVKLAKNLGSGEQVRQEQPHRLYLADKHKSGSREDCSPTVNRRTPQSR